MDNELLKLIAILEKEKENYESLLKIVENKQQSVIHGKVDTLRELIIKEQSIVKKCEKAACDRIEFISQYCIANNMKATGIPLKDFIGFSPEPEKYKMENLRYNLKNILNKISRINKQNDTLLHFSINHLQNMSKIFLHADKEEMNMYDFSGVKYAKNINQKFVNRQI